VIPGTPEPPQPQFESSKAATEKFLGSLIQKLNSSIECEGSVFLLSSNITKEYEFRGIVLKKKVQAIIQAYEVISESLLTINILSKIQLGW